MVKDDEPGGMADRFRGQRRARRLRSAKASVPDPDPATEPEEPTSKAELRTRWLPVSSLRAEGPEGVAMLADLGAVLLVVVAGSGGMVSLLTGRFWPAGLIGIALCLVLAWLLQWVAGHRRP